MSIARLRSVLSELEVALGLHHLPQNERDVLYAILSLAGAEPFAVRSDEIRAHSLVSVIPQASYHRALRALLGRGHIIRAPKPLTAAYLPNWTQSN